MKMQPTDRLLIFQVSGPVTFVVDSVDALAEDSDSNAQTYRFIFDLAKQLNARNSAQPLARDALSGLLINPQIPHS